MRKKILNLFFLVLLIFVFQEPVFCLKIAESKSVGQRGLVHGTHSLSSSEPKSVVALSRSCAEMWLLSGGKLAGCTSDTFDLLKNSGEKLEYSGLSNALSVGTLTTASLESIVSLNADFVILTNDIPLHKSLVGNLKSLGIKIYITEVNSFDDYERVMKDFTSMTGRADLFEKNVVLVKNEIEKIIEKQFGVSTKAVGDSERLAESSSSRATEVVSSKTAGTATDRLAESTNEKGVKSSEPTYLFLRVSSAKNKVMKNTFGNEIFENLGLVSVASDSSALDELSFESILKSDPDYIFVVSQGNQKNAEESFHREYQSNSAWKNLKAVQNNHVKMLPKELFNYKPNANWAEAYRYVYDYISE